MAAGRHVGGMPPGVGRRSTPGRASARLPAGTTCGNVQEHRRRGSVPRPCAKPGRVVPPAREDLTTTSAHAPTHEEPETTRRAAFANRLDDIGWGLFLLVTGGFWLVGDRLPGGAWLTTIGAMLLALGAVRHRAGIRQNVVTLVLGILAVAGGIADLSHASLPLLQLSLVAVGAYLVLKPLFRKSR